VLHKDGGSNEPSNLVTACHRCNSARSDRGLKAFAKSAAAYLNHGITPATITSHVAITTRRPIDVPAAKDMIARRGGFSAALKH